MQPVDRCDYNAGERINDRYTVAKVLGEGSFGKVYLVHDASGMRYAFKLLRLWEVPPDIREPLMQRFEIEFKTGQIDCDNLVRSLDYGTIGGNPFIVMEFCSGGDMTPLLGHANDRAATICRQILTGMDALHRFGKVHRDLKPENVLFKDSGVAALTDFGIAGDRNRRMTSRNIFGKPDQMFGTFAYMPPEQFNRVRGNATVLPTTDIFSFGVLTFQLLTGELPFGRLETHNDLAEYQKHCKDNQWNSHLLRHIPDGQTWERVIDGCLVPDFKHRLQTAREVMALLPQSSYSYNPQPRNPQPYSPQPYNPQPYPGPAPSGMSAGSAPHGYSLQVMQGEEYGRIYDLSSQLAQGRRIITLGRDTSNTVCIRSDLNAFVSRHHCTIETNAQGTMWLLRDGQWQRERGEWALSSNGTYVNSRQATKEGLPLTPGDIITIADTTLRFEHH